MGKDIETRNDVIKSARVDWEKGTKYKDIAKKYNVSESTVKSWAARYWKSGKKSQPQSKKLRTSKNKKSQPKGAPKGNQNACGNGAPFGNDNALKHGGYSAVYWDTLSEEEKELIEDMPKDEETLLLDQIKMCTIRERRILKAIADIKNQKGNQVLSSITRSEAKRTFANADEKELYESKISEEVSSGKRLPGDKYNLTTYTESKDNVLSRLEAEFTKVQNAKTKAIATLSKMNLEKEKLSIIRDRDDVEIENTEETDGLIYG